jgi:hypothetical protein
MQILISRTKGFYSMLYMPHLLCNREPRNFGEFTCSLAEVGIACHEVQCSFAAWTNKRIF